MTDPPPYPLTPVRTVSDEQLRRAKTVSILPLSTDIIFVVIAITVLSVSLSEPRHSPLQIHVLHGTSTAIKMGVAIGQVYTIKKVQKRTYASYTEAYTMTIKVAVLRMFVVAHDFILYSLRNSAGLEMEHIYDWIGVWAAGVYMLYSIMVSILVWAYYFKSDEEVEMLDMSSGVSRYSSMDLDEDDRFYWA